MKSGGRGFLDFARVGVSLVLFAVAAPAARAELRVLDDAQNSEVAKGIVLVRQLGFVNAAEKLRDMYARGTIVVDDRLDSQTWAETNYPLIGDQKIKLSVRAIPDLKNSFYSNTDLGRATLISDRIWLASLLVHEWLHTNQNPAWVRTVGRLYGPRERPAWLLQLQFLKTARASIPANASKYLKMNVDDMIERAEQEIELL